MSTYESQQRYFSMVGESTPLSTQEELQLATNIQDGVNVEESVTKLILSNLRLVSSIANDFSGHGVPTMDLISEGNTGLMLAARKYKPNKNAKFVTYATYWVRQRIQQALTKQSRDVRIPSYMVERQIKLKKIEAELLAKFNRKPTDEEICERMEISLRQLRSARFHCTTCVSIHEDNQNGVTLEDQLSAPEDDSERSKQLNLLPELVEKLDQKEKEVICARFGLDMKKKTLHELGKEFGVSKERIRQIEARALGKLHAWMTNDAAENAAETDGEIMEEEPPSMAPNNRMGAQQHSTTHILACNLV